ncbi:MAG TPA: type II secretion system F family protein [Pyrinomonadaceae bacterium]|nr:type II secretion system F family protein [Pyrinomonadaceae bacterium]
MAATLETPAGPAAAGAREPELIIFNYSGTDPLGTRVKYYLFAEDENHARGSLEESGLTDVEVWARREDLMTRLGRKKKVSRTDIGVFALQLAQRTKANQPVRFAVGEMAKTATHPLMRAALYDVRDAMKGEALTVADAFRKRPDVFPESFVKILAVGAKEGDPTGMLLRYGQSQIKTAENISRITSALIYPGVILALSLVIVFILCYYVLPQMEEMYKGLLETSQAQLPLMTRILLAVSRNITSLPGIAAIAGAVAAVVWLFKWARTPAGAEFFGRRMLKWPLIGEVLRTFNAAYTTRLIAILSNVMKPSEFLQEISEASINAVYGDTLASIKEALTKHRLKLKTAVIPYSWLFTDMFAPAVATAEDTGDLTKLHDTADLLDYEVEKSITRLSKLAEPISIAIAGTIIAMLVMAAYWPLFSLIGQLSNKH